MRSTVDFYNIQVAEYRRWAGRGTPPEITDFVDNDARKISWSRSRRSDVVRGRTARFSESAYAISTYRPFCKQNVYFHREWNESVGQLPLMFPTPKHKNIGFHLNIGGTTAPFCALMVDCVPDLNYFGQGGQFFPRWTYEKVEADDEHLDFGEPKGDGSGYCRVDNVTDDILADYQMTFETTVTKDDIFFYVYGVLHSPQYRHEFAADLKKMLPRIPKASSADDFRAFTQAGRNLADLHVRYEDVDPYPLDEVFKGTLGTDDRELYRVTKMKFKSKADTSTLIYNSHVTLSGIPDEAHRYMLGSRSAVEWLIDRYQIKTDTASGIVNDPNDWCDEHNNPRYIVYLVKRIVTVSVETMKIVDNLPKLNFGS